MAIKLITLNIEASKHLDRVVEFIKDEKPDVVCLQEAFRRDVNTLSDILGMDKDFGPMVYVTEEPQYGDDLVPDVIGVAMLSRVDHYVAVSEYYMGEGKVPLYVGGEQVDRVLTHARFKKDGDEVRIATTHFEWTPKGVPTPRQYQAFDNLERITSQYADLILCGDFNAARGEEMFTKFLKDFTDNLPPEVETTLDPKFFKKPHLRLVVDTIFSKGKYRADNVRTVDGVSDHMAVVGEVYSIT